MDPVRFEQVAARYERLSRASPARYRLTVAAFGLLGYAVAWTALVLAVGLFALVAAGAVAARNVILAKVALPLAVTAWAVARSVWVRFERPDGLRLTRAEAPALFAELDRLRTLGRVPTIHRVLVRDDLNAGVSQTPRLGLLGWPHNDLALGLPLLLTTTPAQFRAVLAHELGHLSGQHGRLGGWVYRVRLTWPRVQGALQARESRLARLFAPFFRWYGPAFAAASLALAREQEREADRFAAAATDPRTAADALVAVALADWALDERFWPAVDRSVAERAEPPAALLEGMAPAVRAALAEPAAREALDRLLLRRAMGSDTHPSLAERLAALGLPARLPPPLGETAAAHFLGPSLPRLAQALDARWREAVGERWATLHAEREAGRARLSALEAALAEREPSADEAWERVQLVATLSGGEAAFPLAEAAVARHPDHAPARFGLGRMLLGRGREEGVAHVERAMALDPDAQPAGAQLLAQFYVSRGENERAAPLIGQAMDLEALHEAARAERASMTTADEIAPHDLPPEQAAALTAALRADPRVRHVYLARKRLRHLPERAPAFAVLVVPARPWWKPWSDAKAQALAGQLAGLLAEVPTTFLFVEGPATRKLVRKARGLRGAVTG